MKVQVEELSPIERKLSVEVPPEVVRQELDRAYAQLSRHVKIPGFRSGKIPRRILEQRFRAEVEGDVIQRVVERSYREAIEEKKVDAVSRPQVTNGALTVDAPFTFEARVEVRPNLTVKDHLELPLKKADRAVAPEKVTEQLESLRQSAARMEPVEDRTVAQAGDWAVVDFEATVEGKPFPGSKKEDITVEIAPGELINSQIAALAGTEVGAIKEIDYAFPPDYRVEEVRSKVASFKLTLRRLKRKIVPELNDDFAKEVGNGDTVDALKENIAKDLARAAEANAASEEREGVIAGLIERNPFDVPSAMIERALDMMLEGAIRNLARSGLDPRMLNLDFDALRADLRDRAEKEVRGSLLLDAVGTQEKIEATDAEIDARIEKLATDSGQPLAAIKKRFRDADEREGLRLRLREEKTVEFLKARAKYS